MVKYSADFVSKAKSLVPNNTILHEALENGNHALVGFHLMLAFRPDFRDDEIVEAAKAGKLFLLLKEAEKNLELRKLYFTWSRYSHEKLPPK